MSSRSRILSRLRAATPAQDGAAWSGAWDGIDQKATGASAHVRPHAPFERPLPRHPWTAWQEALRQQRAEVRVCTPGQAATELASWLQALGVTALMRPQAWPGASSPGQQAGGPSGDPPSALDGEGPPAAPDTGHLASGLSASEQAGHRLLDQAQALTPQLAWHHFSRPIEALEGTLFDEVSLGITLAQGAIADPGVVVLHSGPFQPRSLSLVPPMHLVVVWRSQLWPHVPAWIAQWPRDPQGRPVMPTNLVWVSGPSKTSDIQQTLAFGAHGPQRLLVLAIDDQGAPD